MYHILQVYQIIAPGKGLDNWAVSGFTVYNSNSLGINPVNIGLHSSICLPNGRSDWTHPVDLSLYFAFSDRVIPLTQAMPNSIFTLPLLLWEHYALNTVNKWPPQILWKRILAVQGMKFHLSCNINYTQVMISYQYFKVML